MTEAQYKLSSEQQLELRAALKAYFLDELDQEIGDLQADLFIEFLTEKLCKQFYNLGVMDAMGTIKEKAADLVLLLKDV